MSLHWMNQGVQGKCITNKAAPTRTTRKKELPWVGLEPMTLRLLGRVLFLLSYQGSSAGRASKSQTPILLCYGTEKPSFGACADYPRRNVIAEYVTSK